MALLGLCLALPAAGSTASSYAEVPLTALSSLYWSADFYRNLLQKIGSATLAAGERSVMRIPMAPRYNSNVRAELHFQVSDGIGPTLRQQLAQRMVYANPQQAVQIRTALSSDWLWQEFDHHLSREGYDSRDLGDVMTAYYVSSWEVVHHADVSSEQYRAARNQIVWYLRRSPEIMFMTDIEKQRAAEAFALLVSTIQSGRRDLRQKRDDTGLAYLQNLVYQSVLTQGVDLKRLDIGHRGFIPAAPPNPCAQPAPPGQPPHFGCRR
ncbi:DUF6683 family protein [Solimonas marina]|uniref:DUF6683 family protein n=1 Tax=Solimonas marina TaxID=2714601 RepID=UPI001439E927|nr:DUF6683 family protein [Solimonas marina]